MLQLESALGQQVAGLGWIGVLVLLVAPDEDVREAGLAHPCPAQQHQPRTRVPNKQSHVSINSVRHHANKPKNKRSFIVGPLCGLFLTFRGEKYAV
jgi:hypothetical protein